VGTGAHLAIEHRIIPFNGGHGFHPCHGLPCLVESCQRGADREPGGRGYQGVTALEEIPAVWLWAAAAVGLVLVASLPSTWTILQLFFDEWCETHALVRATVDLHHHTGLVREAGRVEAVHGDCSATVGFPGDAPPACYKKSEWSMVLKIGRQAP
jgi:hypothetical protein